MNKKLPVNCPGCQYKLNVQSLYCDSCQTTISGSFSMPLILQLDAREQEFIIDFVQCSGSLKVMAQNLKLSYPTVRNMLDELINKISIIQKNMNHDKVPDKSV